MPRKESATAHISAQAQQEQVSDGIENYELPKSIVTKIAKSAIPEHAKLQKDTVLSLVKGSTVFINYLAATAHDVASSKQHKSISASDVLKALEIIEFGDLNDMLQNELQIYRNNMKNDKAKKERAEKAAATASAKGKAKEVDPATNANASSASASMSISAAPKSKSKPPTSESAPVSPTISTSISAPGAMLPPPFTSAPRMPPMPMDAEPSSQSEPQPQPEPETLHGDNDEMDVEAGVEDVDVEVDEDVDEADEKREGGEEVQDMMVVEEEIRSDAKGLEEKIGDD